MVFLHFTPTLLPDITDCWNYPIEPPFLRAGNLLTPYSGKFSNFSCDFRSVFDSPGILSPMSCSMPLRTDVHKQTVPLYLMSFYMMRFFRLFCSYSSLFSNLLKGHLCFHSLPNCSMPMYSYQHLTVFYLCPVVELWLRFNECLSSTGKYMFCYNHLDHKMKSLGMLGLPTLSESNYFLLWMGAHGTPHRRGECRRPLVGWEISCPPSHVPPWWN